MVAICGGEIIEEAEIIELLEKNIPDGLLSVTKSRARKVSAEIAPGTIRKAAGTLLSKGARLIVIAAVDAGLDVDLLYHFDLAGKVVLLKVKLGKENPEIGTIADLTPAAEWAENEAAELCGLRFKGHPKPGHLVLSDKFPDGTFPLGKPFKSKLPDEIGPVAEAVITVGATAPISSLEERRRVEAGLPPQPPASYSSEPQLKEVHELIRQTNFSRQAGYDWKRKKLRG